MSLSFLCFCGSHASVKTHPSSAHLSCPVIFFFILFLHKTICCWICGSGDIRLHLLSIPYRQAWFPSMIIGWQFLKNVIFSNQLSLQICDRKKEQNKNKKRKWLFCSILIRPSLPLTLTVANTSFVVGWWLCWWLWRWWWWLRIRNLLCSLAMNRKILVCILDSWRH